MHLKNIFLKGVVWRLAFYISSFLLNIYLANILGASQSGPFFYLINNLAFVIQFLTMGLDISLSYFNAKKEFKVSTLLNLTLHWSLITTLLFSILFYFSYSFDIIHYNYNTLLLILFVFSSILTGLITALFVSSNQLVIPCLIPFICNISLLCYLYTLNGSGETHILHLYLSAYFIASILTCTILTITLLSKTKTVIKLWPIRLKKEIMTYSLNIFLFNLGVNLLLRGDIWLVRYLTNNKDLGNYIQTGKIVQLILLLPNLASFTLLPLLTQQSASNTLLKENVTKLSRLYFLVSLTICCFLCLTGYWLFPFVFGATFDKMYLSFIYLMPGVLLFSASYPIDTFFSSINKNNENIKAALYALLVMVIVDLVLIPHYSIYGAAIGSSASFTLFYFYLLSRFKNS
ncbi:lipopolysaccharide biosynthesis protein [Flavisolibacter tropicus]|uniref:Uncharacterized protein n=1 Tax=Flavisolibacter tropicus TaxID=1492898 RepID=A0A172TQT7_9BACT|nr:polysaccharide biosynthesis C-terminal domain-containing protein [Flavisolibacter tropicus]ANE49368.1 hypothetical protein SY85_01465 [Flavisolibacter tropicus]